MISKLWNQLAMGDDVRPSLIALKEQLKNTSAIEELRGLSQYNTTCLPSLLRNEDAKTRKNAALIMGLVPEENYPEALMRAYETEETLFVRGSYLKALSDGGYDPEPYRTRLKARYDALTKNTAAPEEAKHVAEELRELRRLLPEAVTKSEHHFQDPFKAVRVILTCPKEMRPELLAIMNEENINPEETKEMALGIMTKTARISQIAAYRCYLEMLFPLNGCKAIARADLARAILEGNLFALLGLLHGNSGGAYRFRMSISAKSDLDIVRIARQIEAHSEGRLVNSVSDYELELRLIERPENTYMVFLKIYTRKDERFAYRKNVVATSMHPVKAANMVAKVKNYLKPGAQILDPYCGVGTLLIERNLAVRASNTYGVDTFGDAIRGARANTECAGLKDVYYIHRDSNDFTSDYLFDEIITQMPDWNKDEADEGYRKFFTHSYDLMRKGGLIMMDSAEKGLVHKYMRLMPERYRLIRDFAMKAGDDEYVYVIERL